MYNWFVMNVSRMHLCSRSVKGTFVLLVAFCAMLVAPPSEAIKFSKDEKVALKQGETVRRVFADTGKDGYYGGSGWAMIDAPVDVIWQNVLDWNSYTKIFDYNVETRELYRHKGRSVIRMRLGHPIVNVTYHVEMRPDKKKNTMHFRLLPDMPSDLENIKGYWQFFPQPGDKTLVVYVIGIHIPRGMEVLLPDSFKQQTLHDILNIPGILKEWIEKKKLR